MRQNDPPSETAIGQAAQLPNTDRLITASMAAGAVRPNQSRSLRAHLAAAAVGSMSSRMHLSVAAEAANICGFPPWCYMACTLYAPCTLDTPCAQYTLCALYTPCTQYTALYAIYAMYAIDTHCTLYTARPRGYIILYIYIYIPVNPLPGVETYVLRVSKIIGLLCTRKSVTLKMF